VDELAPLWFCFSHPDWFETPGRYRPRPEYLDLARGLLPPGWRIDRNGVWYVANPPGGLPISQRWTIGLSAVPASTRETLTRVVPLLAREATPFRFVVDDVVLRLMLSGSWPGPAAAGFLTVYPAEPGCAVDLMKQLGEALQDVGGAGLAGHQIPVLPVTDAPSELGDGRYRVDLPLRRSAQGVAYAGYDRRSARRVVVKEGSPHTGLDLAGNDAVALRRREYEILLRIADTGIGPFPVACFQEGDHSFLVEEWVEGVTLGGLTTRTNPLTGLRRGSSDLAAYFEWLENLATRLAAALETLHGRGIVYGDLSPLNVVVTAGRSSMPRLVDFEAAIREGLDAPTGRFTAGLSSPEVRSGDTCRRADDWYALGRLLFGAVLPVQPLLDLEPATLGRVVEELVDDVGLPLGLAARLRASRFAPRPLPERSSGLRTGLRTGFRSAGETEMESALNRSLDYAVAHADTTRADRLVPADPDVFATNPLSVAYGACGLAHALRLVRGKTPGPIRDWMLACSVSPETYPPSLYHGLAGVGWVLAGGGDVERGERLVLDAARHPLVRCQPGVLDGGAGVGLALLEMWTITGDARHLDEAVLVAESLFARRTVRDGLSCWPDPDGRVPVGFGRGSSGIAVFLLSLAGAVGERRYLDVGESAARFDLAQGREVDGQFLGFPRFAGSAPAEPPTLCHDWLTGSAGVGTAAVRYWLATGETVYREALNGLVPDCSRKYAGRPGLSQGLAGMANFLVDAHLATADPGLLRRARETARGILLFAVDRPEGVAFPGNWNLRLSCDFATGSAGVALALDRVLRPERPNFNFLVDRLLPGRAAAVLGGSPGPPATARRSAMLPPGPELLV
jgi:hypothetical protein